MPALNPLPRWQRRGLYASLWLLLASGAAWLAVHYTVGAGAAELPHPSEHWLMRLHGALAMAALLFLGTLLPGHVPRGWRMQRQRRVGIALWSLLGLLVVSGYALYYFVPEEARPATGIVHSGLGALAVLLLVWHRRGSRRMGRPHPVPHPHGKHPRRHHVERRH
jgi:hypothetical protein